jgi:hypothetical protein
VKPPGHTCPDIDEAKSAIRKLVWRLNHDETPVDPAKIKAIAEEGFAALESIRVSNTQMREAYWSMKAERDRAIALLG